jgi:hypothetical protein
MTGELMTYQIIFTAAITLTMIGIVEAGEV